MLLYSISSCAQKFLVSLRPCSQEMELVELGGGRGLVLWVLLKSAQAGSSASCAMWFLLFHLYLLVFIPCWWKGIGWTCKWRQLIWECSPLNCPKLRHSIMGMKTQAIPPILPLPSCGAQQSTNPVHLWGLPMCCLVALMFTDVLSCRQTEHSTYCSSGTHLRSSNT